MNYDRLVKQRKLALVGQDLADADLSVVLDVLAHSAVVEELNLMCNRLTLADGRLAAAVAANKTLKVLGLYGNEIGPEGAKKLAAALKGHTSLEQLALEGNEVGDEGAEALAGALMANDKLRVMILRNNGIGDDGARSLANALLCNASLQVLLLGDNRIGNAGAQRLADALEYNSVVDQVALENNALSGIMELKIKTVLASTSRKTKDEQRSLPRGVVDALLAEKDKKVEEMGRTIDRLREANAKKVEEMGRAIDRLKEANAAKDEEIARRDAALMEKMAELIRAEGRIAELEGTIASPVELLAQFIAKKDGEINALRTALAEKKAKTDERSIMDPPEEEDEMALGDVVASMESATIDASSSEESEDGTEASDGSEEGEIEKEEMIHVVDVAVEASYSEVEVSFTDESAETDASEGSDESAEDPAKADAENREPRVGALRKVLQSNMAVRSKENARRKAVA